MTNTKNNDFRAFALTAFAFILLNLSSPSRAQEVLFLDALSDATKLTVTQGGFGVDLTSGPPYAHFGIAGSDYGGDTPSDRVDYQGFNSGYLEAYGLAAPSLTNPSIVEWQDIDIADKQDLYFSANFASALQPDIADSVVIEAIIDGGTPEQLLLFSSATNDGVFSANVSGSVVNLNSTAQNIRVPIAGVGSLLTLRATLSLSDSSTNGDDIAIDSVLVTSEDPSTPAVSLPVYESFDNAGPRTNYRAVADGPSVQEFLLEGLTGWQYFGETRGRAAVRSDFVRRSVDVNIDGTITQVTSGNILSLDNPGGESINRLVLTVDGSGLTVVDDTVILAFDWYDHGDERDLVDIVEVRGSIADPWIEIYDYGANGTNGAWSEVRNLDISATLQNGSQEFSETTQIRFSQNDNFPINTDGFSIEDLSIEIAQAPAETGSTSPEILTASMMDYVGVPVEEGTTLEYKVALMNPRDATGAVATNVVFELPQFGPETSLVVGSVVTSQGTVTIGNMASDSTVVVNVGDIPDGESQTIYFRAKTALLADGGTAEFFNQGMVSADNVTQFMTEDPRRSAGVADPTLARYARVLRSVTNLEIDDTQPVVGDIVSALATGTGSTAQIMYSSSTPTVCEVINTNMVRLIERGECVLAANQAGDDVYLDAIEATLMFLVDNDVIADDVDNCPAQANPDQADLDGDGQGDVCDNDIDGDGMPNDFEIANGLNPRNSFDRDADPDNDGFSNREEFAFGSNPQVADSDDNGNGVPDLTDEQRRKSAPLPGIITILLDEETR